jgi:PAS domain S-box-containing protein
VPVGVVVVDEELIIRAFNAAAARITGLSAQEALGRPYAEVMQTHQRDVTDPLEEALETGRAFVNQRFYLGNGEAGAKTPIRHSASVLTDAEGQVIGGVTIFADISRQVALERELEGQRRYLGDVLRSLPDGMMTTDNELQIESWNDAAVELTGVSAENAIGRSCVELMGPTVTFVLQRIFKEGGGTAGGQQAYIDTVDGRSLPVEFSASGLQAPANDHLLGGVVVFKDISERLDHQRELDWQRRYLEQILELAPYGIFTVDRDMVIQTFNRAAETLTGFAASFATGKSYSEIVKLDPDSGEDPLPRLLAEGGSSVSRRLMLVDVGGSRVPIRYAVGPLFNAENQMTGAIAIFQDISDVVAAERTKNEFISMVSHELRTPLTSIKGFVTAILDGRVGSINKKQKRFLSISREQSNLLLNLINDMLDLTRLDSGEVDLSKVRVNVAQFLKNVAASIAPLARRKELHVDVEVEADLPPLWADEDKLFQVVQNLLSNAVKFTPMGGEVHVRGDRVDDETVVISVADTGVGIPPEEQGRIFDPFYQVENVQTRSVGGTGLGLAIAARIVEEHGGRIEVESEVGTGSTFRVYLPLKQLAQAVSEISANDIEDKREREPAPVPAPQRPERPVETTDLPDPAEPRLTPLVLVVDDDPAANSLLRFLLEEEGYDVVSAATGQEALSIAQQSHPDLITLDVLMPEMDGFDVLGALKAQSDTADIPVCIVSIIEDKVKGYQLGAIDYVTKPFESDQLLHTVQEALDPHPAGDENCILLVEDNPDIVELVELTLTDAGYTVVTAHDGVTGLEKLRHTRPALVLLDIMLPKLDGYEFIRQAKADPHTTEIPIVVLSVRSLEEDVNRALRLGAEKYLVKASAEQEEDLSRAVTAVVRKALEE